ncbi:MAG: radical SAM protein [Candidatus Helarchaeota archaeon]
MILDKIPRWALRQVTRKCPICKNLFIDVLIDSFTKKKLASDLCNKCRVEQALFGPIVNFALTQYFDVTDEPGGMREILCDSYVRKLLQNAVSGIGKFGLRMPIVFGAPLAVTFNLTNLCNLKCPHCYQDANTSKLPTELTTQEILSIIYQLADYGVIGMLFGGGEPLMHKDIYKILRFTRKLGMFANLSTNGTLITEKVAKKLKETGLSRVSISLDGLGETHDKMRGKSGIFERTVNGIKNCKAVGIETGIAITLSKYNVNEIPDIVEFAKELNLDGVLLNHFVPVGRGKNSVDLDVTPEEREDVLRYFYKELVRVSNTGVGIECFSGGAPYYARIAYQTHVENGRKVIPVSMQTVSSITRRINLHPHYEQKFWDLFYRFAPFIGACTIATSYSCIDPEGNVWPCTLIPMPIGNLRTEKFADIWEKHPLLNALRDRKNIKGPCRDCKFYTCRGCRARPFAYKDDLFESDFACLECRRRLEIE